MSVSHSLMYVALERWPYVFSEFARVLRDGGVIRITEDDTSDTRSSRFGGWKGSEPAVTLTDPAMMRAHLRDAGLMAYDCDPKRTHYVDDSLIQQQHGDPPDCFWVEGVRATRLLFEPHADDATLFASFAVLRYRPHVVTCMPSTGDYGDTAVRAEESRDALVNVLGASSHQQWDRRDIVAKMRELDEKLKPSKVFAPHPNASHADHVAVAEAAAEVFGDRLVRYHTYNAGGKVREGIEAPFEPMWIQAKLRALARFETQIRHARAHKFFLEDLREYLAE